MIKVKKIYRIQKSNTRIYKKTEDKRISKSLSNERFAEILEEVRQKTNKN